MRCWTIGLELENQPATRDLAVTVFEDALASPFACNRQFRFGSVKTPPAADRLVRDGRPADDEAAFSRWSARENSPRAITRA